MKADGTPYHTADCRKGHSARDLRCIAAAHVVKCLQMMNLREASPTQGTGTVIRHQRKTAAVLRKQAIPLDPGSWRLMLITRVSLLLLCSTYT